MKASFGGILAKKTVNRDLGLCTTHGRLFYFKITTIAFACAYSITALIRTETLRRILDVIYSLYNVVDLKMTERRHIYVILGKTEGYTRLLGAHKQISANKTQCIQNIFFILHLTYKIKN